MSFEDVDRLKALAQMENVRIPHFMQDQARYAEQLTKIMTVNQLTDEELKTIIWNHSTLLHKPDHTWKTPAKPLPAMARMPQHQHLHRAW